MWDEGGRALEQQDMAAIAAAARAAAAAAEAGNGIRTVDDVMAQLTENGTELE